MPKPRCFPLAGLRAQLEMAPFLCRLWRWLWLVGLCSFLGALAAFGFSNTITPVYEAGSKLLINEARSPADANYNDLLASERAARTYAELMARASTLHQTFRQLGLDPESVKDQVTDLRIQPVRDTQLVEVTVEGPRPDLIAAVANTLPQVFMAELRSVQTARFAESRTALGAHLESLLRQIEETQLAIGRLDNTNTSEAELERARLTNLLSQYQATYAEVRQTYEALQLAEAQAVDTIVLMEQATVPEQPIRPRTVLNTQLAAVLCALLTLAGLFLVEYLDDRVRTPDDLRRIADLPVLGTIARLPFDHPDHYGPDKLIALHQPHHPEAEAYRRLRTNLQFAGVDAPVRSLMVTSATGGEGKTLTAANLALVMAQSGLQVLLVDADLRRPQQHNLFGLSQGPGLTNAIFGEQGASFLCQPWPEIPNLRLLPAGDTTPFPVETLGSKRMQQLFEQLTGMADLLIVDTPPLLAVSDALIIGRMVDGALLVIDTPQTAGAVVQRALEAMHQVNAPVIGIVLNRVSVRTRGDYYAYFSSPPKVAKDWPQKTMQPPRHREGGASLPLRR